MKKRVGMILLALCMIAGLFVSGSASSQMTVSAKTKDTTTFTVGFDANFPPYGYKDESGEYVGFDLDLAEEVCERNGWTLVKQPIDWDTKDMELNAGSIDCIWNGFTMNGRENDYTWSDAYIDNSQVVIVKADSGITTLSDLEGKTVVVQTDSSALAAFTGDDAEESNIELCDSFQELQQVADYNSAFMNLESGMVDAICMDIGVADYELEKRGDDFTMLSEHISSEQYGIGFKTGNTELRDQVQTTLYEMLDDGTFEEIAENWGLEESICLAQSRDNSVLNEETTEETESADAGATETSSKKNKSHLDIGSVMKQLSSGMLASFSIFFFTLVFALPLGLLIAAGHMSRFKLIQWIMKLYISIMRGTPLMLQLLVVFFGPYYIWKVNMPKGYRFVAIIIGFSINYAAYFAEIYRSGLQAIPAGQHEAAKVLGYTKIQTFWKILFPQMVKHIMPPVTNEVITLVKDTSLAFCLAYTEMFTLAKQIAAAQATIIPLFIAGLFYYLFNFVVAFVMERIEKKLNYYR